MDLKDIIFKSRCLIETFDFLKNYSYEKIYVAAGAVTQTVWNNLFGNDLKYGIDDLDLIYFNDNDLSELHEDNVSNDIKKGLGQIGLNLDIKNQARVHLWYQDKFGYKIESIKSLEDSISRFPTTATSVGIGYNDLNGLDIIAPFGLDDLLHGIIRPNKRQITEAIYSDKVSKWTKKWPGLKVIEW
jgi:uncharacterized protein